MYVWKCDGNNIRTILPRFSSNSEVNTRKSRGNVSLILVVQYPYGPIYMYVRKWRSMIMKSNTCMY